MRSISIIIEHSFSSTYQGSHWSHREGNLNVEVDVLDRESAANLAVVLVVEVEGWLDEGERGGELECLRWKPQGH